MREIQRLNFKELQDLQDLQDLQLCFLLFQDCHEVDTEFSEPLGEDVSETTESVNLDVLTRIASLRGSALLYIDIGGRRITLRTALTQIALRTCRKLPYRGLPTLQGVGDIVSLWCESITEQEEGASKLRRHSGVTNIDDLQGSVQSRVQGFHDFGISVFMATCSPFAGPRLFRYIVRCGIVGIDLDQSKAAVRAMVQRHPEHTGSLQAYITDPTPFHAELLGPEDDKGALFRAFHVVEALV